MVLLVFLLFFFIGISIFFYTPMKLVICMEFLYVYLIFSSQRFLALGMNIGMYIMIFSAAEGILGLTLVMDTGKFFDLKHKSNFGFF
uniref:NADH dehydrogenase subunit 4L n=1 Tax=Clavelina oblonga TaxID=286222 RepID=A0A024FSG4_9ASCI|nr:NADH dehydrogenase subunit 4L [Clavelina oblonga]CAL24389.1 NADH dehydrogenase subunit 4L [Clavelina oblonga]